MSVACVRHMCPSPPELLGGGGVLSLVLYTMYTSSCRSAYSNNYYFKYADDTALVDLLSDDETDYRSDIDHFVCGQLP